MIKQTVLAIAVASVSTGVLAYGGEINSNDYNTNYAQGSHGYVGQIDGNHNEQWIGDDWSTNVDVDVDQSQNDYSETNYVTNNYYTTTGGKTGKSNAGDGDRRDAAQDSPTPLSELPSSAFASEVQSLRQADQSLRAGIAGAVAAASHQFDVGPGGGVQMSLAGGYYDSESAVSLAVGGQMTERTFGNINVTYDSQDNYAVGAAVNLRVW